MRVLVLHSDVAADAPPDEQDTLFTASAVADALRERGHTALGGTFVPDPKALARMLGDARAECVFNLVESVFGQGDLAGVAAAMLERVRVPYTGTSAAALACLADKPMTKRLLRRGGLPTPAWCEPPIWEGLDDGCTYVVKAMHEDASIGLDDGAVAKGSAAVKARAASCAASLGGAWFAELYCPGREFNISIVEEAIAPRVLPIAEIRFENWSPQRARVVGYAAKWHSDSPDSLNTPRVFGIEDELPSLARDLDALAREAWNLFGLRGYARVDIRLDTAGSPMILEINPNPCLEPAAGLAAAAMEAGISYADLVERILQTAAGN
jgi:D-alanine-D-alanine ligase